MAPALPVNADIFRTLLQLDAAAVRRVHLGSHGPDELAEVTDGHLATAIAAHWRRIDYVADVVCSLNEQSGRDELRRLCDIIADTAIETARRQQDVAADGSLSLGEWKRQSQDRPMIPVEVTDPIPVGARVVVDVGLGHSGGTVLAGPYVPVGWSLYGEPEPVYDVQSDDSRVRRWTAEHVTLPRAA